MRLPVVSQFVYLHILSKAKRAVYKKRGRKGGSPHMPLTVLMGVKLLKAFFMLQLNSEARKNKGNVSEGVGYNVFSLKVQVV